VKRTLSVLLAVLVAALGTGFATAPGALADSYVPISGDGSTWAQNAVQQWVTDVKQYGMRINYNGTGSGQGRTDFLNQTVDYAVSDIPFQTNPTDGSAPEDPSKTPYVYMPIVAGGTAFMYHLTIGGKRVTNLRLSGTNIAKIFTGAITLWNDPSIAKDNPGLTLPAEKIVPVVRSDSSGSSAQFSIWMSQQQSPIWNAYYQKLGKGSHGGETSYWPTTGAMIAQSGDLGVAGYVAQSYGEGSIGYVEYSYALNAGYPVVKMLNAAGYYAEPTAYNVAVALTKAKVNTSNPNDPATYLTQDLSQVYSYTDPRVYPLSSYSYMILPTNANRQNFSTDKGKTLAAFANYFMCQGQQRAAALGYSPLPANLVMAGLQQIEKVPGETVLPAGKTVTLADVKGCNNPTLDPSNPTSNKLAKEAPMPKACDKAGTSQCPDGTGGDQTLTAVKSSASGGNQAAASSTAGATSGTTAHGTATGATGATAPGATSGPTGGAAPGTNNTASVAPAANAGGTTGAAPADPNAPVAAQDPNAVAAAQDVTATPVSVDASSGWSGQQTLIVLAIVVLAALFIAPPLLARRLRGSSK
jgi:phosphate transport system substrate-binding protein